MARRRRPEGGTPPDGLLTFDPGDWPGEGYEAWAAWHRAREEWHEVHGWPGGEAGWIVADQEAREVSPDAPWDPSEVWQVRDRERVDRE